MPRNQLLFEKAKILRETGNSYFEVSKKLNVPKSTLSNWFSGKKWSESIKLQLIEKHRENSRNNFVYLNSLKHTQTIKRHNLYREEARSEYSDLRNNLLFISGLSLYWGEGEKAVISRVSLINTDPEMLQLIVKFYKKILKVHPDMLRAALFLYKDLDIIEALDFWSLKLNIPKNQFIKTQILPSRTKLKKKKVIYGICNVYFSDTKMNIKINEWIRLLSKDMRV